MIGELLMANGLDRKVIISKNGSSAQMVKVDIINNDLGLRQKMFFYDDTEECELLAGHRYNLLWEVRGKNGQKVQLEIITPEHRKKIVKTTLSEAGFDMGVIQFVV
ncbi:MAG: hypothetical protein KDD94_02380 [Calditrichaeota bacterium]|nr:hypothetical protein [Calditrichota bacterium]